MALNFSSVSFFTDENFVLDFTSIGTLFAFVLVCGGVLVLQNKPDVPRGSFKTPYMNAGIVLPAAFGLGLIYTLTLGFQGNPVFNAIYNYTTYCFNNKSDYCLYWRNK